MLHFRNAKRENQSRSLSTATEVQGRQKRRAPMAPAFTFPYSVWIYRLFFRYTLPLMVRMTTRLPPPLATPLMVFLGVP